METSPRPLPILDWKSTHDPASRAYPMRAMIAQRPEKRRRTWKPGVVLDQGSEGACVGFGWTGALISSPRRVTEPVTPEQGNLFAAAVYRRAQVLDDWPGEGYVGTSVLAGAKAIAEKGLIESYRWCFGIDDVRDALITEGPVIIGVPWFESMYETSAEYEVTIDGDQVGGHCILLTGYDPAHTSYEGREMYRWRNSWGEAYGYRGSAWIDAGDLAELLGDAGEACVPIGSRAVALA